MASPARNQGTSLSPFAPTQASRGHDVRSPPRIVIDPTPENQRIYNEIRRTHERSNLQSHVASQQTLQPLPTAPSVSTIHSPIEDPETPSTQDAAAQDGDRPRRPRGRRRGPLEAATRLNTALKRRFKLTCTHHRAKKTTCDCHDFSRLEERYHNSPLSQSLSPSNIPSSTHMNQPPMNHDLLFVAGGDAITPADNDDIVNELNYLQPPIGNDDNLPRQTVQQFLSGFDDQNLHSAILQTPGQTYHPGNGMNTPSPGGQMQEELLEIGSQMYDYPNRWYCGYKGPVDSAPETSSETCSWSGSFQELSRHFRTQHHPFIDASPRFWFVCPRCHTRAEDPNDNEQLSSLHPCSRAFCTGICEKWYYGSTRDESTTGSAFPLTQYSESEGGYSWNPQLDGNYSWGGTGGSPSGCNRYYGAYSPYERTYSHSSKWDTSSSSSSDLSDLSKDRPRPHPLRKGCTACRSSAVARKPLYVVCLTRTISHPCPLHLLAYAKLSIACLPSILLQLMATTIRTSGYFIKSSQVALHKTNIDAVSWLSLVLALVGFLVTWVLKDQSKSWTTNETNGQARGRQWVRIRIASDEVSTWRRFSTPIRI
ncbi:hypothetical protein M426DRAFT_318023 [Hypoxylon sp. CI-4A]|nr:hypothetical protein M426DRAFT_318023 [Hypoxylon sp. CI-4A]